MVLGQSEASVQDISHLRDLQDFDARVDPADLDTRGLILCHLADLFLTLAIHPLQLQTLHTSKNSKLIVADGSCILLHNMFLVSCFSFDRDKPEKFFTIYREFLAI